MLKKLAAISLTAGALVLIAPSAASAAPTDLASVSVSSFTDDPYANTPDVTVADPVISICEVSTIAFGSGYFQPSEQVAVSVSRVSNGSGGNAVGAGEQVPVAVSGLTVAASAISGDVAATDGSLVLTFRPPAEGEGTYAVAFAGEQRSYTATITVAHEDASTCSQDPGVAPAGTELPLNGDGLELALTGGSVSPWALGGGALALAAGGVLVAVGAARRKRA
ncbi:MAG: hypothetical protein ACQEW8_09105 [Actinomycetota bacterium]